MPTQRGRSVAFRNIDMRPGTQPEAGRLAPSPTGGLHLGHARTFLAAWLFARSCGGRVVLRVEDLDVTRIRPEAIQGAIDDLRWLGLTWDEGPDVSGPRAPYIQTARFALYDEALRRLRENELIYPCTCTRTEIARAASAPHAEDEGPTYPGTCADRRATDADTLAGRPFAWRFRVNPGPVSWDDRILGPVAIDPSAVGGDFIVARESVGPAYQLAVVVDDAAMGITQVIRGDDLVSSTPRQILLYRALGLQPPVFGHLPLVHGPDGRRLAKRDGSIKLATLRAAGVEPQHFLAWLAATLGIPSETRAGVPADWVELFALDRIPRSPLTLSLEDLDAFSRGSVPSLD
jgi:glutamyl-tRNA synthetase